MKESRDQSPEETVRCLSCDFSYTKPAGGGTVNENPGCPECGYAGWVADSSLTPFEPHHFDEDHPRRRSA